jgi:hypothetical protein
MWYAKSERMHIEKCVLKSGVNFCTYFKSITALTSKTVFKKKEK